MITRTVIELRIKRQNVSVNAGSYQSGTPQVTIGNERFTRPIKNRINSRI